MGLAALNIKTAMKLKIYEWDFVRRSQRIRKLAISPQPSAALFSFKTVQPTVPVVEIFRNVSGDPALDMKPENLVASAFNFIDALLGNLFTVHKVKMTGLPQASRFHYRITAGDGKFPSAVVVGTFATSSRKLSVIVRDVMIFNDGDPGAKASGELEFDFGFYFEQSLVSTREFNANIESGEVRDFPLGKGPTFVTGQVPDTFSVFVRGTEWDTGLLDDFHTDWSPEVELPQTLQVFENDDKVVVEAVQTLAMPDAPGTYNFPLAIKSVPGGIHYWINGRIDVDVVPPSEAPFVPFDYLLDIEDAEKFKTVSLAGAGGKSGMRAGGKIHSFAIGPEHSLYMRRPGEEWTKLDDGAGLSDRCECDFTADIARDDHDRIHILTLRAGTLRHASLPAKGRAEAPRFKPLGEGLQRQPTVVSAEDGTAYLFARDVEGALRVAALTGSERGRWIDLGGRFVTPVSAHVSRRDIAIFGVTSEGQPIGGIWRIGSSKRPDWAVLGRGLGEARVRHIDVIVERSRTHLMALAEDRRLLTLNQSGEGWTGSWKDYGSLDAFFFEMPAAPQRKTKAKLKKANGAARPTPARRRGAGESARATV